MNCSFEQISSWIDTEKLIIEKEIDTRMFYLALKKYD